MGGANPGVADKGDGLVSHFKISGHFGKYYMSLPELVSFLFNRRSSSSEVLLPGLVFWMLRSWNGNVKRCRDKWVKGQ